MRFKFKIIYYGRLVLIKWILLNVILVEGIWMKNDGFLIIYVVIKV